MQTIDLSHLANNFLENVPEAHGIYIFKSLQGRYLYIGKSINLKKRIKDHYRHQDRSHKSKRFTQRAHTLDLIETQNELESLLLEAALVKRLRPIYNRALRKKKFVTILSESTTEAGYAFIQRKQAESENQAVLQDGLAVMRSYGSAQKYLEKIQRQTHLCPQFLDLEPFNKGKCYLHDFDRCSGSCIGELSSAEHNKLFHQQFIDKALELWPFEQAQKISFRDNPNFFVIFDNWKLVKVVSSTEMKEVYKIGKNFTFDLDTYKILFRFLKKRKEDLVIEPFSHESSFMQANAETAGFEPAKPRRVQD